MKSILISIKPEWVAKILNGEKTIEVRKTAPKCDLPIDVYIYCTKENKEGLVFDKEGRGLVNKKLFPYAKNCLENDRLLNGKVVAKFTLNKVEGIRFDDKEVQRKACITEDKLFDYLFVDEPYHEDMKKGYAWHISDLLIFDKPKELTDFVKSGITSYGTVKNFASSMGRDYPKKRYIERCKQYGYLITKAPQSWCYCEEVLE